MVRGEKDRSACVTLKGSTLGPTEFGPVAPHKSAQAHCFACDLHVNHEVNLPL